MNNRIMKRAACSLALLLPVLAGPAMAELVINPHEVAGSIDFGQIVKGRIKGATYEDQPITRTGVYLTVSGVRDERLEVRMTVGGLLWLPLMPPTDASPGARIVQFGPGVGQAQAIYSFGDVENPSSKLQFGLFPIKYNPDAANLGEYLYRSGAYPGYVWNGGWSYLNSASYLAQGVRFNLPTFSGKVTHDFTLFMDRNIEPIHDLAPGYLLTVKPNSIFEIGAGAVWAHAITLKKEEAANGISPEKKDNAYSKATGRPVNYAGDSSACLDYYNDKVANAAGKSDCGYYTFRGVKAMVRASADIGALLHVDAIRPGDFKLYGEVAVLGVQDQPFYYDDVTRRMPMMLGLNVPTFGILDRLAVEMEYYRSRFLNDIGQPLNSNLPLPTADPPSDYGPGTKEYTKDDLKWSVYARREITQGLTLYAQAASDNARHFDVVMANPYDTPATRTPSEWYYVLRLEFGLF
jgi:hypothetical protein